jgi:hypothetical protein
MSNFTITPLEDTFKGHKSLNDDSIRSIHLGDSFFEDFHGHLFSEALVPFLPEGGAAKITLERKNYNRFLATLVDLGGVFTFAPGKDNEYKYLYLNRNEGDGEGPITMLEVKFND